MTLESGDHILTLNSSVDGSSQPYRLFVPTAIGKGSILPLLIVLHGQGADYNTWFEVTPVKKLAEEYEYLVASPNGRGPTYYDGPGEQDVLDVIAAVSDHLVVDEDRIFMAGHSLGGWGTWSIALRHRKRFASICPMSGPVPEALLEHTCGLAPLIIHDVGDPVVSVEASRRAAKALSERGIAFGYLEKTGFGHESRMIGAVLPEVFDWFEQHPRAEAG